MTVKELKKYLDQFASDTQVMFVKDWEKCEDGLLTELEDFDESHIGSQGFTVDIGMDFEDVTQVLIG
ncbi:MAG: hypothetical protein MJZ84_07420 [Paludibacteraceae bacterium]|nr:hypothetical protein [Paludibacteraceae bacterium]